MYRKRLSTALAAAVIALGVGYSTFGLDLAA